MHAFSHTSYHIISHTGIHSTDTQQHRDATHTYTRTYIHAHRCMYMSRYVAYLLHPFIVFFIGALCRGREVRFAGFGQKGAKRSTRRTAKETMSITAEKVTLPHPTPPNQSPTPAQCVCLQAKVNVITPPHPTQPKPDPSLVRVFASETERYYPTPPHPTKAQPQLSACVCKRN